VIDFHTHLFSRPFFEGLAQLSPLPGTVEERLRAVAARAHIELPSADLAAHVARWLGELERHGVERAVSFASLPVEAETALEAARLARGRLVPFAVLDPRQPGAAERASGLLARGLRGLVLFPALHHFRADGPEARALLDAADAAGAVVVVHCGRLEVKLRELLAIPSPYDASFARPAYVAGAALAHPRSAFVIPHFGAGELAATLAAGRAAPNVLVDTSSSNAWMAEAVPALDLADAFRAALDAFGPERVLFGTDSSTFPRGFRADLLRAQRAALESLRRPAAAAEAVFGGNARRLLGP
jgi:predicted TIM-barrel fold metal-dependent hydrolase